MKEKKKKQLDFAKQIAIDYSYWIAQNKWQKYPGIDKWFTTGKVRIPYKTTEELFELFFNQYK